MNSYYLFKKNKSDKFWKPMDEFERILFKGFFNQRFKDRKLVELPRDMSVMEAMNFAMDYSAKKNKECGFIFDSYKDKVWFFIEGSEDIVKTGKSKYDFHTHPSEDKECLPSIDDLMSDNTETVVIGCPKLKKIVSIRRKGVCWDKKIKSLINSANTAVSDYEAWEKEWREKMKRARDIDDSDLIDSLEYEHLQQVSTFNLFMNSLEETSSKFIKKCGLVKELQF